MSQPPNTLRRSHVFARVFVLIAALTMAAWQTLTAAVLFQLSPADAPIPLPRLGTAGAVGLGLGLFLMHYGQLVFPLRGHGWILPLGGVIVGLTGVLAFQSPPALTLTTLGLAMVIALAWLRWRLPEAVTARGVKHFVIGLGLVPPAVLLLFAVLSVPG